MFDRVDAIELSFQKAREAALPFVAGFNITALELELEKQKIECFEMLREQQEREDAKV